jgi:hypothetical protein
MTWPDVVETTVVCFTGVIALAVWAASKKDKK